MKYLVALGFLLVVGRVEAEVAEVSSNSVVVVLTSEDLARMGYSGGQANVQDAVPVMNDSFLLADWRSGVGRVDRCVQLWQDSCAEAEAFAAANRDCAEAEIENALIALATGGIVPQSRHCSVDDPARIVSSNWAALPVTYGGESFRGSTPRFCVANSCIAVNAQLERFVQAAQHEVRDTGDLYTSGVRYEAERGTDIWYLPLWTRLRGKGDCEDLAIWLTAQRRNEGRFAWARVVGVQARRGTSKRSVWHTVVVYEDGSVEDPARTLGMVIGEIPHIEDLDRVGGFFNDVGDAINSVLSDAGDAVEGWFGGDDAHVGSWSEDEELVMAVGAGASVLLLLLLL